MDLGVIGMARKTTRTTSGPTKTAAGAPALNPTALQDGNRYLDPTVALREAEHPSSRWAGLELQPVKPRV
jgi:hypothetical protein